MKSRAAIAALAALAQESRLRVFRALVQAGPAGLAAGSIAKQTRIAPSSLSFHLKELRHAGLATVRHEGRFIFYAINVATMNSLLSFLTENCCGGEDCGVVCAPAPEKKA